MNTELDRTNLTADDIFGPEEDKSTDNLDLPVISTAAFGTMATRPVCIARSMPRGLNIPHLVVLAPSWDLLDRWRDSNKSDECWSAYVRDYWSEIASRCKADESIWKGAHELLEQGLDTDMRGACLAYILKSLALKTGVNKITLCCYERPEDQWCHRKLIYDALPEQMKGVRG